MLSLLTTMWTVPAKASPSGGALPAPLELDLQISGTFGVPADAVGVALNVTVTNPVGPGYVAVYPCGDVPNASNLNYATDQTVPNFVITRLSAEGDVCISTSQTTDVVVDLAGYVPNGSQLTLLPQPQRFLDTRVHVGAGVRTTANGVTAVQLAGVMGVPQDASLVVFNATAVDPTGPGFLSVYPCGQNPPSSSTLNFQPGETVPNLVITGVGANGTVCFYSNTAMDLVGDVAGYVEGDEEQVVMLAAPQRVLDTRDGTGGPATPLDSTGRSLRVAGVGGVAADASAAIVNMTAVGAVGPGYATAYPCGQNVPLVSNVNYVAAAARANLAIVQLGPTGDLCLTSSQRTDVIVDVSGFVVGALDFVPQAPTRIYDSRLDGLPRCNRGVRFAQPQQLQIIDLTNGAIVGSASIPSSGLRPPAVYVRRDCSGIDVVDLTTRTVLDMTGVVKRSQPLAAAVSAYQLMINDGGVYGVTNESGSPQRLVDAVTGRTVFTLPTLAPGPGGSPLSLWTSAGSTADGSLFALARPTQPGDLNRLTVLTFTGDGQQIASFTPPPGASEFKLSTYGTYLSFAINTAYDVVTPDGAHIGTLPFGENQIAKLVSWMGDGSTLVCLTASNLAQRWDLFSPRQPLVPTSPNLDCLADAA